jgi:hypothetical protein
MCLDKSSRIAATDSEIDVSMYFHNIENARYMFIARRNCLEDTKFKKFACTKTFKTVVLQAV